MEVIQAFGAQQDRPRKRRRRTMACTNCRLRKLRCDREFPSCSRCRKSRSNTSCTYEDGFLWQQPATVAPSALPPGRGSSTSARTKPEEGPAYSTPASGLRETRPEEPLSASASEPVSASDGPGPRRRHINRGFLETVLGAPKAAVDQDPYVNTDLLQRPRRVEFELPHSAQGIEENDDARSENLLSPSHRLAISPRIMMRGRETKTRFTGSGIIANVVAQFPDIRAFAEDIRLSNPIMSQVRPDLERVRRGLWKRKPLNEPFPEPTTESLATLLPSRGVVDELIALYIAYVESTHRIFHIPSFLREVDDFWENRENPSVQSAPFVAQLLLVLACAWNFTSLASLQKKSPAPLKCHTAIEWVLHSEKWVHNAQIKRPQISTLRLQILLIMARNAFGMKRSQAWLATSTLVKSAMMAGYHRDPSKNSRISVFNKEMRRRIWVTILELDLQVAIDRGMPPSIQSSDHDSLRPLNIDDEELDETTVESPRDRPVHEITDSSFATALARSLDLRLKTCALMHSPHINCRYEEIQRLDWEFNRHLSQIPSWSAANTDMITKEKVLLWNSLIKTKIAQSLLSLHTPFAIEAPHAAVMILSTQRLMHETSPQLSLGMLGEWTMQAFMSVCQALHNLDSGSQASTFQLHALPGLPDTLVSLLETALIAMEVNLLLVVKGAKDYFFLSTIESLVKAQLWPVQETMYKQQVVERVLNFAQTLFSQHATCEHLGELGLGNFQENQVAASLASQGMAPVVPADFTSVLPPSSLGNMPSPGSFDPFLDVFDWDNWTGMALLT
ncbi:hypothetical protein N7470_005399 [Penicillium chermesinum]|nr:hypothetical protein N7470_005399 [Penicillium chermesinum]